MLQLHLTDVNEITSKESKIKLDLIQGHLEKNLRDDKHNDKNTHQSSLFQSIQTD